MVFDIANVKKIRKQLGLTQFELAKKSGLSQSLIAKIESNRLDPTYSRVKKIEETFDLLTKNEQKEAKDIMIKHIIYVNENTKVIEIIKILNKHKISQVPVLKNENIIGLISESTILKNNSGNIKDLKAEDMMDNAPPIISGNTKIEVIKNLLKYYPIVLVKEKGKLTGLISKSDLINSLV
ncbi:CBS domain-containing protein [Candidatus Woesearchaeota archaeon]|nr:CBS domain-containing protein [Candidatus Woesearchaeota archaeon]